MKDCFYLYKEVYWEASWGEKHYKSIEGSQEFLGTFYDKEKAIEGTKVKAIEGDFHALGHLEGGWKTRIVITVRDENGEVVAEKTYKEEDYDL